VHLDSCENYEMAVLLPYQEGRQRFDVPRELLTEDARAGNSFGASFAHDRDGTRRTAAENRRLLNSLLGRADG